MKEKKEFFKITSELKTGLDLLPNGVRSTSEEHKLKNKLHNMIKSLEEIYRELFAKHETLSRNVNAKNKAVNK